MVLAGSNISRVTVIHRCLSVCVDACVCGTLANPASIVQVRYAGYSMLASMCGEKGVVEKLMVDWAPGEHFGLWGACMRVAVDLTEWVLVRQQVGFLSTVEPQPSTVEPPLIRTPCNVDTLQDSHPPYLFHLLKSGHLTN